MAEDLYRVELTASFVARLDAIEAFLTKADAAFGFDELLAELRATVIPNIARFPLIGRRYLDAPPQSAEGLCLLATLPTTVLGRLVEYPHDDYQVLYLYVHSLKTVQLLSVRHRGEISALREERPATAKKI